MSDFILGIIVGVVGCAFMVIGSLSLGNEGKLKDCAREHNSYSCEFVAVPKQPDEARK